MIRGSPDPFPIFEGRVRLRQTTPQAGACAQKRHRAPDAGHDSVLKNQSIRSSIIIIIQTLRRRRDNKTKRFSRHFRLCILCSVRIKSCVHPDKQQNKKVFRSLPSVYYYVQSGMGGAYPDSWLSVHL